MDLAELSLSLEVSHFEQTLSIYGEVEQDEACKCVTPSSNWLLSKQQRQLEKHLEESQHQRLLSCHNQMPCPATENMAQACKYDLCPAPNYSNAFIVRDHEGNLLLVN